LSFLRDIQSLQKGQGKTGGGTTEEGEEICPYCDGYGHIITATDVQLCSCLRKRTYERNLKRANIPPRYKNKDLDTFKTEIDIQRLALRQVRRFVQEFEGASECPGLFLYGAPGTGKTHLAIGALKELIARGFTGLFLNIVTLVDSLRKQSAGSIPTEEENRLQLLEEVEILVLDDLGAGRLTDFIQERIYTLVDQRYSRNQCMIVTSNLGLRKLEEQVTYPVLSRVRGMCFTVNTGDLDFRNPDLQMKSRKK
jgi:DNA replication protein DnaC